MKRALFLLYLLFIFVFWVSIASGATLALELKKANAKWIPTKNSVVEVTATLEAAPGNSHVTFQLISTNWPGYCMNKDDEEIGRSPDLKFVEEEDQGPGKKGEDTIIPLKWIMSDDGRAITAVWESDTAPTTLPLKVNCYDYGAIGKINAGLYTGGDENGPRYATAQVMIPYTTGQSYIAEAQKSKPIWVGWSGNDADDLERGPGGNTNNGDGLTAFEEYRGFEIKEEHTRTSPLESDFIRRLLGDFTVMKIQPKQVTLDHHGNPPVVLHLPEPV